MSVFIGAGHSIGECSSAECYNNITSDVINALGYKDKTKRRRILSLCTGGGSCETYMMQKLFGKGYRNVHLVCFDPGHVPETWIEQLKKDVRMYDRTAEYHTSWDSILSALQEKFDVVMSCNFFITDNAPNYTALASLVHSVCAQNEEILFVYTSWENLKEALGFMNSGVLRKHYTNQNTSYVEGFKKWFDKRKAHPPTENHVTVEPYWKNYEHLPAKKTDIERQRKPFRLF